MHLQLYCRTLDRREQIIVHNNILTSKSDTRLRNELTKPPAMTVFSTLVSSVDVIFSSPTSPINMAPEGSLMVFDETDGHDVWVMIKGSVRVS